MFRSGNLSRGIDQLSAMKHTCSIFSVLFVLSIPSSVRARSHDLIGYWQNWNDVSAPYIQLDQVDPRYSVIEVAFAEPVIGSTSNMQFAPAEVSQAMLIGQIQTLQAAGKKVLISIGGANATVQLNSDAQRDEFINSTLAILNTFGFDGMDLDLEGASVSITGGTIALPIDQPIVRLTTAVDSIATQYETLHGHHMMLTMAPETAFVQGGQSAFGGIWGAYLPLINALRDRLDILQVQLYNSGSMYGIDGGIYDQATADFIVSQTEAVIHGFDTGGGHFDGLPPEKVAVALPACMAAAGGGYTSPTVVAAAIHYLRGDGPQPGSYASIGTYPALRGLMTWSINWDAVSTCNAASYEYAQNYEDIFGITTAISGVSTSSPLLLWPSPVRVGEAIHFGSSTGSRSLDLIDVTGRIAARLMIDADGSAMLPAVSAGSYIVRCPTDHVFSRIVVADRPR